jgi:dTMP kinase
MIKNPYKGTLVVFEGIDGCGKTSQVKLLTDYLKKKKINPNTKNFGVGVKFIVTKEPTDGPIGKLIRQALSGKLKIDNHGLQLLFAADRDYHLQNKVIPYLKKGHIVISDRYILSTVAYGGLTQKMDWFIEMNKNFLLPDITFIFKVRPEIGLKRLNKDRSKLEIFEKIRILKKVEKNYEILAKKFKNIYLINGEKSIGDCFIDIKKIIDQKLKLFN